MFENETVFSFHAKDLGTHALGKISAIAVLPLYSLAVKTDQPPASVIQRFLALDVLEQGENDFAEELGEVTLLQGFCLTKGRRRVLYIAWELSIGQF